MHIFCDFDGTISLKDTSDAVLSRFASPEWEMIESQWERGEIGSNDCMKRQIALLSVTKPELDQMLDDFPIDPAFPAFVTLCQSQNLPLTILSDGVDYFIHRILSRYQLDHLPIIANQLRMTGDRTYALSSPHHNPLCATKAGVCKCRQIELHTTTNVFIGDGRSDFCAADKADVVFAKTSFAAYCTQQKIPFIAYQTFTDITHELTRMLATAPHARLRPGAHPTRQLTV